METTALVEAAGQVVSVRAATRATALEEAATPVETTTGQEAATEEATGRGLAWWRSWRGLGGNLAGNTAAAMRAAGSAHCRCH